MFSSIWSIIYCALHRFRPCFLPVTASIRSLPSRFRILSDPNSVLRKDGFSATNLNIFSSLQARDRYQWFFAAHGFPAWRYTAHHHQLWSDLFACCPTYILVTSSMFDFLPILNAPSLEGVCLIGAKPTAPNSGILRLNKTWSMVYIEYSHCGITTNKSVDDLSPAMHCMGISIFSTRMWFSMRPLPRR